MSDPSGKLRTGPNDLDNTPSVETDQNPAPGGSFDADRHAAVTARSQRVGRDGAGPATAVNKSL
jgi:hypothetical protein